jgi:hypothetical protein
MDESKLTIHINDMIDHMMTAYKDETKQLVVARAIQVMLDFKYMHDKSYSQSSVMPIDFNQKTKDYVQSIFGQIKLAFDNNDKSTLTEMFLDALLIY